MREIGVRKREGKEKWSMKPREIRDERKTYELEKFKFLWKPGQKKTERTSERKMRRLLSTAILR